MPYVRPEGALAWMFIDFEAQTPGRTVAEAIADMQAEEDRALDCPKCEATGRYRPNPDLEPTIYVVCDVCKGMAKTKNIVDTIIIASEFRERPDDPEPLP